MYLKRKINFRNTLAFRLTLWYAIVFTISSTLVFLIFYLGVSSYFRYQTDQDLQDQVRRFSILLTSQGTLSLGDSAIIEAEAAGVKEVFFRFLYVNGQVFSSSNMSYWKDIGLDETAIRTLLAHDVPVFRTIEIAGRRDNIRILYAELSPSIIMQVGVTMRSNSRFLDAFRGVFIATTICLVFLAAGVGWFMARRAVSGIEAVTRTAQTISGSSLEERVPVKARGDEIDQLALTFNQMLDRIQRLLTEIKEMSDNMAHDLRSPIARIRGAAEITLTSGKALGEYEAMAANTVEECDRLLEMINTMLIISKTDSGVDKSPFKNVDLTAIVRQAYELFEPTAEDKKMVFSCDAPDGIHLIGDTPMIQRMFSNLVDNAIKYTPSGGTVNIGLSETPSQVVITVKDTGIGISQQDLPRIFERFYRCDQSRSQTGIGLGLSLARAIARSHGGDINVQSVPGQGSVFNVTLPKCISSISNITHL
jgi:heavy metal sensor kinase